MIWILPALICYVSGSIPVSLIVGKISKGVDIRELGSGNAGATNSYRELGMIPGLIVLLFDFLKAFIPILLIKLALERNNQPSNLFYRDLLLILCHLSVITGHVFPVFAGFKGGKAVASGAGGITALIPVISPLCLTVFITTAVLTRYVSLSSLLAAWSLPLFYGGMVLAGWQELSIVYLIYFIFIALIITILHRKNIKALLEGTERKLSKTSAQKKK